MYPLYGHFHLIVIERSKCGVKISPAVLNNYLGTRVCVSPHGHVGVLFDVSLILEARITMFSTVTDA